MRRWGNLKREKKCGMVKNSSVEMRVEKTAPYDRGGKRSDWKRQDQITGLETMRLEKFKTWHQCAGCGKRQTEFCGKPKMQERA